MNVPPDIAVCPTCDGPLDIEIDAWEDDGTPVEEGFHVVCTAGHPPGMADQMPYVYWLPIDVRAYAWAKDRVRAAPDPPWEPVTCEEYDRRKLAAWNAWARGDQKA